MKHRKIILCAAAAAVALGLTSCSQAPEESAPAAPPEEPAALSAELQAELEKKTGLELVEYLKGGPEVPGFAFADERLSSMLSPGMEDKELLAAAKDLASGPSTSGRKASTLR